MNNGVLLLVIMHLHNSNLSRASLLTSPRLFQQFIIKSVLGIVFNKFKSIFLLFDVQCVENKKIFFEGFGIYSILNI